MLRIIIITGLVMGMFLPACPVLAEKSSNTKDEYVFDRLARERNDIYEQYVRALRKGKEELKAEGDIDLKTKNEILDLRTKKDRVETRLITIAMRHGWDIPSLTEPQVGKRLDIEARELEKVFGIVNILVKSELRKDTGLFTANLNLPTQKVDLR